MSSSTGSTTPPATSEPSSAEDLAPAIFSNDAGIPPSKLPRVVAVPVSRAVATVDENTKPDYKEPLPAVQGRLNPLSRLELRYSVGHVGSGTREWLPPGMLLRASGHLEYHLRSPYSQPNVPSVCNDVYHGPATPDDPLPVLEDTKVEPCGWVPLAESSSGWGSPSSGWTPGVVADYSGPVGTVRRSTGVSTSLKMSEVEVRPFDNWNRAPGPSKSMSKY